MKISAVFLDRDGVLNHDDPTYTKRVKDVVIHRDVPNAIRRLSDAGIKLFVVSNQACVSKGIIKNETARAVFNEVIRQSQSGGGIITDFFYCPHQDSDGCSCRKPEPGLLLKVAKKHNVKLERSVFVGDGY